MAQAVNPSPYAIPPTAADVVPAYVSPAGGAYAAPSPEAANSDGWWDNTGFAPVLRTSAVGVPDATRLKQTTLYETRPGEGDPVAFFQRYDADVNDRDRASTYTDADGMERIAPENPNAYKSRPNPSDTGEPRPTMRMNPHRYVFLRPFGQGLPKMPVRTLDGVHFSLADHRREYPVLGMQPVSQRRNTYRIEPPPWDANIVDVPPQPTVGDYRIPETDAVPIPNTAFRLDG